MPERLQQLSEDFWMARGYVAWQQHGQTRSLVPVGTPVALRVLLMGGSVMFGAMAFAAAKLAGMAWVPSMALPILATACMAGLLFAGAWYVDQRERNLGPVCVLDLSRRVIELPRLNIQMSFDSAAAIGFAQGEPPNEADCYWVTQVLLVTRADPVTKYVIAICPRGAGGAHAIASTIADIVGVEVVQCRLCHEWVSHETTP